MSTITTILSVIKMTDNNRCWVHSRLLPLTPGSELEEQILKSTEFQALRPEVGKDVGREHPPGSPWVPLGSSHAGAGRPPASPCGHFSAIRFALLPSP